MERDENVHQIEVRLTDAKIEVRKAEEKVRCINEELRAAMQQVFEERMGVKDGDIITTLKGGTKFYYERFIIDSWGGIYILVHPVKNDGTASKAIRHLSYGAFIACI